MATVYGKQNKWLPVVVPGDGLVILAQIPESTNSELNPRNTSYREERTVAQAIEITYNYNNLIVENAVSRAVLMYDPNSRYYTGGVWLLQEENSPTYGDFFGYLTPIDDYPWYDVMDPTGKGTAGSLVYMGGIEWENTQGIACSTITKPKAGEIGCFDTLPGLFEIEVVSGTVIEGVEAYVKVKAKDNTFVEWASTFTDNIYRIRDLFNGWDVYHPYISSDSIKVDISTSNHNYHVIPGLDIQFSDTVTDSDLFCIASGYTFVNRKHEEDTDLAYYFGHSEFYLPVTNRGWLLDGTEDPVWEGPEVGKINTETWNDMIVMNVTAASVLETVTMRFSKLLRLTQAKTDPLLPFESFCMGYPVTLPGAITEDVDYTITFVNVVAGEPKIVDVEINASVNMSIKEIDPATFEPTTVDHVNGTGLKADSTTIYRWDALGVYFTLSESIIENSSATLYVYQGQSNLGEPASTLIGHWGAEQTEPYLWNGVMDKYPWPLNSIVTTGMLQRQGYSQTIDCFPGITFANHYVSFTPRGTHTFNSLSWSSNPAGFAIMATCSDKRYFQVIPAFYNYRPQGHYSANYTYGKYWPNEASISDQSTIGRFLTAVEGVSEDLRTTHNIQFQNRDLMIRLNGMPSSVKTALAAVGVKVAT